MKKAQLKKLSLEFADFLAADVELIDSKIKEFYFSKYGCNNSTREEEILNYYLNN